MIDSQTLVETDVDLLVSLVKHKGQVSIEDAAKILKISLVTVQKWTDFLVEEEVLGIEYKFVTPYLYFNKDLKRNAAYMGAEEKRLEDRATFFEKAKKKGISENKIEPLWTRYLSENLEEIKDIFYTRAKLKNVRGNKADKLWEKFYDGLLHA